MFNKKLAALAVGLIGSIAAAQVHAVPTTALYLTMDGSGSISAGDFTTQVNAYVSALNNIFAATPSLYGQVAIGGGIFGLNFVEYFQTQAISNAGVLANLTTAISGLNPGRGGVNTGATAIGDAVTASANALVAYENSLQSDLKLLIDVTTDGQNNAGSNPNTVANTLTPIPIDSVNCLGIGAAASCAWVAGAGTDFGSALNFGEFQAALQKKLEQEFDVPEPGTLAMLGLGLLGMVASRRKQ
ncbi:MAG: DUF1194 domain-containing protein [Candidatus Accumulibacter necessarius]|jgi:hypothetical protein|uniref:DUF1194 domain-containing protein n=1 Tax=Candidatus Accumulibacter necessarius TaxID=2954386 RepID=UPI002FC3BAF0